MYKKKNTQKEEKEKENTGVMAQIQYESAEHSPNLIPISFGQSIGRV